MATPEIYNITNNTSGIWTGLFKDKILVGMGLIALLSFVGAVIENGYALKLGNNSSYMNMEK